MATQLCEVAYAITLTVESTEILPNLRTQVIQKGHCAAAAPHQGHIRSVCADFSVGGKLFKPTPCQSRLRAVGMIAKEFTEDLRRIFVSPHCRQRLRC